MKRVCLNPVCPTRAVPIRADRVYCLTCTRELDVYPVTLGELFARKP